MDQSERKQFYFNREVGQSLLPISHLRLITVFALLFLYLCGFSQTTADFDFYKDITINAGQVAGPSALTDFPFLFSTTSSEFATTTNGGMFNSPNGYDIMFTNSDGSVVLDHQLESYDPLTGRIIAWVKTDVDPTTNTIIRIYFGSTTILTDLSSTDTWDSNYQAVWHLDDTNDDGTSTGADLGNSGSSNSSNAMVGDAQNFDEGTHLQTSVNNDLNIAGDLSLEAWINLDVPFDDKYANTIISAAGNETGANFPYYLNIDKSGPDYKIGIFWEFGGGFDTGDFEYILSSNIPINPEGSWHHVAVSRDATSKEVSFYVNGNLIGTEPYTDDATPSDANHSVRLGRSHEDTADERMDGKLDEVRISNSSRSPEWMTTSFNSMSTPHAFFSLGITNNVVSCDASFSYAKGLYCETETHPTANITGVAGGVFSSPDGNITFNNTNNGDINLLTSSKGGPYEVVYTAFAGCSDTIEISIDPRPSAANAGLDQDACGGSDIALTATAPMVGSGQWTISSGGTGGFDDNTSPTAVFTPDARSGSYTLTWTVSNSSCFDTFDDVIVSFIDLTAANAGTDQIGNTCGNVTASTSMAGNVAISGSGVWNVLGSTTGGSFDSTIDPTAQFTGDVNKTYDLQWTITNGSCISRDTVRLFFEQEIIANAGTDQIGNICGVGTANVSLSGNNATPGNGLWNVIGGATGGSFDDPTDSGATFSGDVNKTYDLQWTITNGSCISRDTVRLFFDQEINANAGPDQIGIVCGIASNSTNLSGNSAIPGVGNWNVIGGTTGGSFSNSNDPSAVFTGDVNKTYDLQWTITNGSCITRDTVQIFFEQVVNADAGIDQTVCSQNATLSGNTPALGIVLWRTIVGPGTISNNTSNSTLVNNLQAGNNEFEYTVTNGICIDIDTVSILVDNTAPTFTAVVSDTVFYFDAGCNTSYIPGNLEAIFTATDNCSSTISFSYDPWTLGCGSNRTQNVTATVEDGVGNTTMHSYVVSEQDTTRPTFTVPANLTVHRGIGCAVDTMVTNTLSPISLDDNCTSTPTISYSDAAVIGSCPGDVVITRTWMVSDECGNVRSADQIITIADTTSPTFTAPNDTILYFDNVCFADTLTSSIGDVTNEDDNCSYTNDASYINVITSGCGSNYTFYRIWTLFDDCGNSSIDTQYVEVLDTTSPTFTAPPDLTLYMDITCDADTAGIISQAGEVLDEDDNTCSTGLEATYTNSIDASGACGSGYVITRTWSLVDDCGNTTTRDQIITVLDSIAPVLTVPSTSTIYLDASCVYDADSSITGAPTGLLDNCDLMLSDPTISDVVVAGTCEGEFLITRTWTIADICGNSRSYNQTINVLDTISPTFTAPRDTNLYFNLDCDPITTTIALLGDVTDEDDNCTTTLDATHNDVINTICGSSYRILRTWRLIDDCGNTTTQTQTINVLDTIQPTYTIPLDITLYQDGSCRADTSFVGTGFVNDELDNCSSGLTAIYRDSVVTPLCVGSYVVYRLWSLSDECGNTNRQTQVITVLDQVAPTFFTPQNDTLYTDNTCFVDTTLVGLGNIITVLENCSTLDTAYSDVVTPLCEGSYRLFRTWTLTDECGNATSRDQIIVVLDTISPSFTVPRDTLLHLDITCSPNLFPISTGDVIDADDNCTTSLTPTYSDSPTAGCGNSQVILRTWTLNDECGNSVSSVQTITVVDTTAPTFIVPTDITVYKNGICREDIAPFVTGDVTTESDYCPGVNQATYSDTSLSGSCSGSYVVERTWTVTDACGNSSSQVQMITISDTTRPYFTMPIDRIVYVDASCVADTAIGSTGIVTAAGDNCDLSPVLSFVQTIIDGTCTGNYDIERTWTLTDNCGNARIGTQTIQVRDDTPPVLNIPADQTIYVGGGTSCNDVTSIGFEGGYQSWIQGGPHCDLEAQFPNSGTNSVRLQNNSASSLITSPTLNLSSYTQAFIDFSYYVAHMNNGETFEVQISNNGDPYSALAVLVAGTDFVDGNRYNPSIAIPPALLSSNIRVRFRLFGDTNSEQIFLDDIAIRGCTFDSGCNANTSTATLGTASSTVDNCSGTAVPTFTDIIESNCGNTFITRRTWTITDDCGNTNSATQTIQVLDTISPEMTIPGDLVFYVDNSCTSIDTTTTGTGSPTILGDNCDPSPQLTYVDSYSNQCGDQVTISRLWTIGDVCGNRRSATQTIEIIDTISPVLLGIPANAHFQCSTPTAPPAIGVDITATDNCDTDVTIILSESSTRTFNNSCSDVIYTITRTWTATDDCGNSTSRVQNITAECECCNNGIDDDGDGAIDESDNDCPCTTSQVSLNCSPSYYYFIPSIWRMTGGNFDDPSKLTITTPNGTANYTIRTADGSFNQTRTVTQGAADIIYPTTAHILTTGANQVEDDKGFIIESDQALQVLYQLDAHFNKLLITYKGEQALGQRFRVASQNKHLWKYASCSR